MDYSEVLKYQDTLAKTYKYKPIPPMFREEALRFYKDNLPEQFSLDGANVPLYSPEGLMLCSKYNRVVVGDYGAFVEILPEDIVHNNIKVKKGQEYRDSDERYSARVKYSWLTATDSSDIKIYFQKKKVDYADYIPGRYYISPYECSVSKVFSKDKGNSVRRVEIEAWLKKQGVFTPDLLDYYDKLGAVCGKCLEYAVEHNMFPGDFELWIRLNEVCEVVGGITIEQFDAIRYNLDLIEFSFDELKGRLSALSEDVQVAIRLGLEGFPLPIDYNELKSSDIRMLLNMDCDTLLCVSHLSKVLAGCKCETLVQDVGVLIEEADIKGRQDGAMRDKTHSTPAKDEVCIG